MLTSSRQETPRKGNLICTLRKTGDAGLKHYMSQNLEQERLFQLIAGLANLLYRKIVVASMRTILKIEVVDNGDCVLFGDLTVKFGESGKVIGIYRTIDGETDITEITT
jgi:hypothetical protein